MSFDFGQIGQITKSFKTSSAAVPAILLGLVGSIVCFGFASILPGDVRSILVFAGIGLLFLPVIQISFFTAFDRDRLQNEEHVEKKLVIAQNRSFIGDRDTIIDAESSPSELGANPLLESPRDV